MHLEISKDLEASIQAKARAAGFRTVEEYVLDLVGHEEGSPDAPRDEWLRSFDDLVKRGIPYHVSAPARGEAGNLQALKEDIASERIDFGFLYWPDLDGLMHRVGNDSPEVPAKLQRYEEQIADLLDVAHRHYREVWKEAPRAPPGTLPRPA